ncbi:DsbA family protein [Paenibacillus sp. GCM10027626]|uniref:DsbA family oxidoreductase n=1 Tax=Paenibacillus sp. GCM10027626 TaxID=3273411 RepID=UPI00363C0619
MAKNNLNNMMCDLETGVCGEAGSNAMEFIDLSAPAKKVTLYYTTDPICSHCWALEPVLRRFTEQYGDYIQLRTIMGGLLPNWDGFADVSNGIGKPADVAAHWREVGEHSRMPIDGSLWLDNPIASSYPPSRVFKVIQQQSDSGAAIFLRRAREAVFAFNANIADPAVLTQLVDEIGLNGAAIVQEAEMTHARQLLEEDFDLARSLGVRGFPTVIMVNEENKGVKIVGARSLDTYVAALSQIVGDSKPAAKPVPPLAAVLKQEKRLFAKEIEVLYDWTPEQAAEQVRQQLAADSYTMHELLGEWYIEGLKS